ncbi:MAG: TIM barrel protein [Oscillospiraceae bacterium]|nr:TIM barrel protein [Oscillospiraceae bacterium]
MDIGLQTFTIRKLLRTPHSIDRTFAVLSDIGLRSIELAVDYLGFPFTTQTALMIAESAKRHSLRVISCQIKYATSSADIPATAEFMQTLGAGILTNSVIDLKLLNKGEDGLGRYCDMLAELRAKLKPSGISLAHHNHHYEFLRVGGQNVLSFMAANSDVDFVLDTYWCQRGGGNVIALLHELRGRVPLMHLRDFTVTKMGLITGGADCEIGRGNIPFGAVLRAADATEVGYGMIEQKTKTPLESVKLSFDKGASLLCQI